jgi:hypothetical protein
MIKKILNKVLGFLVRLIYGKLPIDVRYFYRDTYYCQVVQWKYFLKDYVIKKKYKHTSFDGEFAPELQFALPFAYWHFKNGTLKGTESAKFTKELYFFSPEHAETFETRTNEGNYNYEMPRILYSQNYNMKKWAAVPLKDMYKNDVYKYEKPILILANRYNMEWDGPPISFYSIELLDYIFSNLKDKYTIIYNRPKPQNITMDNSDVYDLDEFSWIETTYPDVILMEDLYQKNIGKANNFNHLQMMVYANSDRFISIHGGTATLASYFGGINLILSRKGPEHHFNCYHKLYPKFSGAEILHAKTDEAVKSYVKNYYS